MELILSFAAFALATALCLGAGISMAPALLVAIACFGFVAWRRGFAPGELVRMFVGGMWDARIVVTVMLLIGCLTSLWRQSGTIAYFTYYGIKFIPPVLFLPAAFILSALMSYALGTSFGVAGTMGVILMTIARASGVNPALVGGAVMSGLYVGDRGSPAASSASLVAHETGTEVSGNVRLMLRSSLLPLLLCLLLYIGLSPLARPEEVDTALLTEFGSEFRLSPLCLLPTLLLLLLAFAGMEIKRVMLINIAASFAIAVFVQGMPPLEVLRMTLIGYTPQSTQLVPVLSGGGAASMLDVEALLLLSSGLTGIFGGTHLLDAVLDFFTRLCGRIGRFPAMVVASTLVSGVFCNQATGIIMCRQCMGRNYGDSREEKQALMLDIENSVVTIAGLVPWCIACSVPLKMLCCGISALPFAAYLYLIPICWYLTLRHRTSGQLNGV